MVKVSRDERGVIFALIFLFIFGYAVNTFQGLELTLFDISFSFEENSNYIVLFGLITSFLIFLKVRREKTEVEEEGYAE